MLIDLTLVGIGTGHPDHLTRQGIAALNAADLILVPRKGESKADLATLRQDLCAAVLTNPHTRIVPFDMPPRDGGPDYAGAVDRWHDAVAQAWAAGIAAHLPRGGRLALLVWGDPSLYDSTLRIAERLKKSGHNLRCTVVPGITALQALTAAHAIPLNELNAPVTITTGRRLREEGWPSSADTVAVMLDGACAFAHLAGTDAGHAITIWWGAYLGMPNQLLASGPLVDVAEGIVRQRTAARQAHGWIMDTYLLRRTRH